MAIDYRPNLGEELVYDFFIEKGWSVEDVRKIKSY